MAIKLSVSRIAYDDDLMGREVTPATPKYPHALSPSVVTCPTCSGCGWLFSSALLGVMKVMIWLKTGMCPTCKGIGHL
jgi:DnaJ-class molecular chaperone